MWQLDFLWSRMLILPKASLDPHFCTVRILDSHHRLAFHCLWDTMSYHTLLTEVGPRSQAAHGNCRSLSACGSLCSVS